MNTTASQQALLFDRDPMAVPIARQKDPETSHTAARQVSNSGQRASQQIAALNAVRAYPGRTSFELTRCCSLDRYVLARRLPELEAAGKVRKAQVRICRISGQRAHTWEPA